MGDKLLAGIGAAGSPDVLNALLTAAKIKLAYTESAEHATAREQRYWETRTRWFAAMPGSIRPLWTGTMESESRPDLEKLRHALAKEYPATTPRILALFGWFGSGAGPWTGCPMYESVAEQLLLDFPTLDLVSTAQTADLSEQQLEGAARLFGGWDFSRHRPDDLKALPSELKNKLLVHALKTADEDKQGRARHTFEQP